MKNFIYKRWKSLLIVSLLSFILIFRIFSSNQSRKPNSITPVEKEAISQTQTTDWLGNSYDPENTGKEVESASEKTLTSTGWKKPEKPYSIPPDNNDMKITLKEDYVVPSTPTYILGLLNLPPIQSQHLIDFNYAPRSLVHFDVTEDGKKETIITSVGVGCGRCVDFYISIFTDMGVFDMKVNEGAIVPKQDGNGFYLVNKYWGKESSTVEISKYVLEQKQFKEIARKTVTSTAKKQTTPIEMKTYTNARFNYSIQFPKTWQEGEEPTNGYGKALYKDKDNEVLVYGTNMPSTFSTQDVDVGRGIILTKDDQIATKLEYSDENNKVRYIVFFSDMENVQYVLNATVTNDFYARNGSTLNQIAASLTVVKPLTKYTLIESHRGVPRLVSMQEGQSLLTSNEYYDLLKQRIEKDNISAKIWFESKCNEFWIFDKPNDEFVSIERHGYHWDGCPGDPNIAPRLDVFNIDKVTKEIFWMNPGSIKNIPYADWAKTISKD